MKEILNDRIKNDCLEKVLDILNNENLNKVDLHKLKKSGVRIICGKDALVSKCGSLAFILIFVDGHYITKLYYVNEVLNSIHRFDANHKKSKIDIVKEYIPTFEPILIKSSNVKFLEQHDIGINSKYEYRKHVEQFMTYEELLEVLGKCD